jgi:ferredoxin
MKVYMQGFKRIMQCPPQRTLIVARFKDEAVRLSDSLDEGISVRIVSGLHELAMSIAQTPCCVGVGREIMRRTSTTKVSMPTLNVEGAGQYQLPERKRLVLALEQDAGIDQLHTCGGNARRTTCRIEFLDSEPACRIVAERDVLAARGMSGVRLSCQIVCDHDMTVRIIIRLAGSGRKDAGHAPASDITPPPVWIDK